MKRTASIFLIGLFVWSSACTSWQQIEVGEVTDYSQIRVTRLDGRQNEVLNPRLNGDGISSNDGAVVVPVAAVYTVEARRDDALLTGALVLGVAAVVVGGVIAYHEIEKSLDFNFFGNGY